MTMNDSGDVVGKYQWYPTGVAQTAFLYTPEPALVDSEHRWSTQRSES